MNKQKRRKSEWHERRLASNRRPSLIARHPFYTVSFSIAAFLAAVSMVQINEFFFAYLLLVLSAASMVAVTRLWPGSHERQLLTRFLRFGGYTVTVGLLLVWAADFYRIKDDRAWSNLLGKRVEPVLRPVRRGGCSIVIPFDLRFGGMIASGSVKQGALFGELNQVAIAGVIGDDLSWMVPGEYKANGWNPFKQAVNDRKPTSDAERRAFLGQALQYYIIGKLNDLQHDSEVVSADISGRFRSSTRRMGVLTPDRQMIPATAVASALAPNRFSRLAQLPANRRFSFPFSDQTVYIAPASSRIRLDNVQLDDGSLKYIFYLKSDGLYTLTVTVESMALSRELTGFTADSGGDLADTAVPYLYTVTWEFAFRTGTSDRSRESDYANWADDLFSALQSTVVN